MREIWMKKYKSFKDLAYVRNFFKNCQYSYLNSNDIHHDITNKQVIYSINEIIYASNFYIKYYNYLYNDGGDNHIYCDKFIGMIDFIINKFLSNNHGEFINKTIQFEDKHSYGFESSQTTVRLLWTTLSLRNRRAID